jgi:hypothetical protein
MTAIESILISGSDDWVYLAEVSDLVRDKTPTSSETEHMELTLSVISELVRNGWMEIGDLPATGTDGKFRPWKLSVDESLARIRKEWVALRKPINLGEICWLAITPAGDAKAEKLNLPHQD